MMLAGEYPHLKNRNYSFERCIGGRASPAVNKEVAPKALARGLFHYALNRQRKFK